MKTMKLHAIKSAALALAVSTVLANSASAGTFAINFDNVVSGSDANSAVAGIGISFNYAVYLPLTDAYGDAIPGTEYWQNDPTAPAVTVSDPALRGYGTAPSSPNALDAIDQPVLMHFDPYFNLRSFAFTLDNSTYGNLGNSLIYFLDANHQVIAQLDSYQSIPGYSASIAFPLDSMPNVQDVVLASGAFYDNITLTVPEPGTLPLLASSLALLVVMTRRKQAKTSTIDC
jgi:hypothetical protein